MKLATSAAPVLRPAYANDAQAGRNVVQHFAVRLADLMDRAAAAGADCRFDIERHVLALKMVRHSEPFFGSGLSQHVFGGDFGQRRLGSGDIGVEVFKSEIELILVEPFRAAPELAALQCLDEIAEPVDLGLCLGALVGAFRHERADHLMQRGDVGRQGIEIDSHAPSLRRRMADRGRYCSRDRNELRM